MADKETKIKQIMIEAIETTRPSEIAEKCRPIWNQPFFYKIDKANAITFSYAPTDKGARKNYGDLYNKYQSNNLTLTSNQIYDLLYNFEKENYWRKNYDRILTALNVDLTKIAHVDMSCFAYDKDKYRQFYVDNGIDKTYKYALSILDILGDELKFILVDGKDNEKMIKDYFIDDYNFVSETKISVNKSNRLSPLKVYRHKFRQTVLIYFGTFLYGATCVSEECISQIINFVKKSL